MCMDLSSCILKVLQIKENLFNKNIETIIKIDFVG